MTYDMAEDDVVARANLILDDRIQAHRRTRAVFGKRIALGAMVHNMLYGGDVELDRDQLADCLAVAIERLSGDG